MTPEIVRENDFLLQKQNGLTTVVGYTGKEDCLTLPAAAEGSIGLLDAKAAVIMAPILDAGEKSYVASVQTVIPLSERPRDVKRRSFRSASA
ncbi:MAG: hypothetical protein IKM00_07245 [Clostridia bacterium]|nr:hypothetical protein [Clostridia bacterium]MBR6744990.1 hypothetical protein [Clostridia bacterium]